MRYTFIIFMFVAASIAMMSSSAGRAADANEGNTGAPGDNAKKCASCHIGGNFGLSGNILVLDSDGEEVLAYNPGELYRVQLTLNTTSNPNAFGFQMVSLSDADNSDTGGFVSASPNAQIVPINNRTYAEHAGPSVSNVFTIDWKAPTQGSGDVSFYSAFNAVNLNSNTNGDQASNTSFTIEEAPFTNTSSTELDEVLLFPNPATQTIRLQTEQKNVHTVAIYSLLGANVIRADYNDAGIQLDIADLATGMYILHLLDNENQLLDSKNFVKE